MIVDSAGQRTSEDSPKFIQQANSLKDARPSSRNNDWGRKRSKPNGAGDQDVSPALLLAAATLPPQCPQYIDSPVSPPQQPLWTCSSMLKCRNEMSCHPVGEVSLPFLDCLGRICDRLCPRKRRQPIRFDGLSTAPMYPYNTGPDYSAPPGSEYR